MIEFKNGNLFNDFEKVEAIINTVNCVGVMGKGVAKEFSKRFPQLLPEYKIKCSTKELVIGRNYVYKIPNPQKTKYIVNFPSKNHWRGDSKIEYVEKGLNDLVNVIKDLKIKSIAMPALGCGNGNLEWEVVKPLIINKLSPLNNIEIIVYEPSLNAKNEKKSIVKKPRLSKDRKILLLLIEIYSRVDSNPKITYKEINLLSYLMHFNNSKLRFELMPYGPYSSDVNSVINSFAHYYIKPLERKNGDDATPIEIITLDFPKKAEIVKDKEFKELKELINDFELKRNLLVLAVGLWMYNTNNNFGVELNNQITTWLKDNNYPCENIIIDKVVSRLEKVFYKVENLTLDL